MRNTFFCKAVLATIGVLGLASMAHAQFLFGSFEDSAPDGFGSWDPSANGGNGGIVPFTSDTTGTTYSYSSTGATNGSVALDVSHSGYAQDVAFDFLANADESEFLNNDILSFNVTAPASNGAYTAGYWQVYGVSLNATGAGFHDLGSDPAVSQGYYSSFGGATDTFSFNYDAYKSTISANPSTLEMIIAVNDGGGAPTNFYFDNFTLSAAPEPASLSLAAIGGLVLMRRRRA